MVRGFLAEAEVVCEQPCAFLRPPSHQKLLQLQFNLMTDSSNRHNTVLLAAGMGIQFSILLAMVADPKWNVSLKETQADLLHQGFLLGGQNRSSLLLS